MTGLPDNDSFADFAEAMNVEAEYLAAHGAGT